MSFVMTEETERISFRASDDRMVGEIMISAAPPAPSVIEIRDFLSSMGVLFGLKDDKINKAISEPENWVAVAFGREPVSAEDGRPEYHFEIERPKVKIESDGSADFKDLGILENVTAGQLLATLRDPVRGEPGRRIDGEIIEQSGSAKPAKLRAGKNVELSADGKTITSKIDGRVVLDHSKRVYVDNVFMIPGDVGAETGNIDFIGTVAVGGNVTTGFSVKADEKVFVRGHVEGGRIEASSGIEIRGGIFGVNKAELRTTGNIVCNHAQECVLMAGGVIHVKESLLRVIASAGRAVIAENGPIVGGRTFAPVVRAKGLGSEADARTIVETGIGSVPRMNCYRLEEMFIKLREELLKVKTALDPIREKKDAGKILSDEDVAALTDLEKKEYAFELKILEIVAMIRKELSSKELFGPGEIEIEGPVYPGVVLSSADMERTVRDPLKSLSVKAEEGKLKGGGGSQ